MIRTVDILVCDRCQEMLSSGLPHVIEGPCHIDPGDFRISEPCQENYDRIKLLGLASDWTEYAPGAFACPECSGSPDELLKIADPDDEAKCHARLWDPSPN